MKIKIKKHLSMEYLDMPLDEFIDWLKEECLFQAMPPDVRISINPTFDYDVSSIEAYIYYEREEADSEKHRRESKENHDKQIRLERLHKEIKDLEA